jgi:dihydrofolate reductase
MTFFARVTTRPPPTTTTATNATNAIIMGRKTYDSLPKHLRPLGKRINVVITRDTEGKVKRGILEELEGQREKEKQQRIKKKKQKQQEEEEEHGQQQQNGSSAGEGKKVAENEPEPTTDAIVSTSLESALESLDHMTTTTTTTQVGNIFVIGGGEIYASALRLPPDSPYGRSLRIVMTKVKRKGTNDHEDASAQAFECDTFFPLNEDDLSPERGWREVSAEELSGWVGETVSPDWKDDGDVSIKIVGYERIS